ncbi:MAG: YolD-like family protein [Bacillota bacterium]
MSIKDRGNIKWTSLMLVEHREKLEKLKRSENKIKKPELSEEKLNRLDYLFKKALNKNLNIKITYYQRKHLHQWKGKIKKISPENSQVIFYNNKKNEKLKINLEDIVNIELMAEGEGFEPSRHL